MREIPRLKRLVSRLIEQGPQHRNNTIKIFRAIRECTADEFTEDNKPTREAYLSECFEESK